MVTNNLFDKKELPKKRSYNVSLHIFLLFKELLNENVHFLEKFNLIGTVVFQRDYRVS